MFKVFNLALILLAVCPTSQASGNSKQAFRTAYYSQIAFRESPFADLRGLYPINQQLAQSHKHYRFLYDQHDRVIEVSFGQGDVIQEPNISRNVLFFTPVTKITYDGEQETRVFFDRFMNPTTSNGAFKEVFELDADGNRVKLSFFDFEGQPIDNGWGIARYVWTIDPRGTVTENRFSLSGEPAMIRPGFQFYCLKLHYAETGFLAMMENYGPNCVKLTDNNQFAAQDRLQYNAEGSMYAWNVYNKKEERSAGNGPMVARGIIVPDSRGHAVGEYYEDTNGRIMMSAYGWTNTKAVFDKHGNMIERANFDAQGRPLLNNQAGYQGYKIRFDNEGMYREHLAYYDVDGAPTLHKTRGYHAVETKRNGDGNVTSLIFLDVEGLRVNRIDSCISQIVHEYDNLKRRSVTRHYDNEGKPVHSCSDGWHQMEYIYHNGGPLSHTVRD